MTEATREIERLTGLSVEQFRQVMVLPQGQFRKLLMADSKDRETIFSQLFSTSIYKRIEYCLKDQALALKREVEDILRMKKGILQTLGLENIDQLTAAIEELTLAENSARVFKKQQQLAYLNSAKLLEQARNIQRYFSELKALGEQQQHLKLQQGKIVAVKQQLLRAEEAQTITAAYQRQQQVVLQISELQAGLNHSLIDLEQSQTLLLEAKEAQQVTPSLRQ